MFLTDDEVFHLTGRRRAKMQAEWLRSRRIRHYVNAAGKVVVARAWIERAGDQGTDFAPPFAPDFAQLEV